jgi:hypothetical protein
MSRIIQAVYCYFELNSNVAPRLGHKAAEYLVYLYEWTASVFVGVVKW